MVDIQIEDASEGEDCKPLTIVGEQATNLLRIPNACSINSKLLQDEITEIESSYGGDNLVCWVCRNFIVNSAYINPCDCKVSTHTDCLVKWMNDYYKGRCPKCRFLYKVQTESIPIGQWRKDPMLRPARFYIRVSINLVVIFVIVMCVLFLGTLAKSNPMPTLTSQTIKVCVLVVLISGFVFYQVYQTRAYIQLYERLKIYNNRILEVYGVNEKVANIERQHNLSSVVLPLSNVSLQ